MDRKKICEVCENELLDLNGESINGTRLFTDLKFCPECGLVQKGRVVKYDPKKELIEFLNGLKEIFKNGDENITKDLSKKNRKRIFSLCKDIFERIKDEDCIVVNYSLNDNVEFTVYFNYDVKSDTYKALIKMEAYYDTMEYMHYEDDENDVFYEITLDKIDDIIEIIENNKFNKN